MTRRALLSRSSLLLTAAAATAMPKPVRSQARPSLVRLVANENPYGPSPAAQNAASRAIGESWKYAFRQEGALKDMIAEREGASARHVMIADGSGEVLRIAGLIYGSGGGSILTAKPTFTFLGDYARQLGANIDEVPLDDAMRHDLDAMASRVKEGTRLVYICNPNNPTGTVINGATLREFVKLMSARAPVLVDEAYVELSEKPEALTVVPRVIAGDNVIVTRTFSKLHGMAGLRIGYAIAPPAMIKKLEQHRMSMLNLPGLRAAQASYQDAEYLRRTRAKIVEARALTVGWLDELGLKHAPAHGNFILFDTGGSPAAFSKAMRAEGFMIGRSYAPYRSWVRVSMGTVEQMRDFAVAARRYFSS